MHVYVEACNGDHYLGRYEARTNNVNIGISIHFGIITSEPEAIYVTYIPFKAMRGRIQLSLSLIFVEKWSHLPTNIGLLGTKTKQHMINQFFYPRFGRMSRCDLFQPIIVLYFRVE